MFTVAAIVEATRGRLIQGNPGMRIRGVSTDSRTIRKGDCFIALKGPRYDGHDYIAQAVERGAAALITERGRSLPRSCRAAAIEVADGCTALGDLARCWRRRFSIPVIAITGSNGKTTAKEMVARVLGARYRVLKNEGTLNNQVGVPQTLLRLRASHDVAVLELGTNHFGEIAYLASVAEPTMSVITNIGPSHLAFLRDLEGVYREKSALLASLHSPRLALVNADDRYLLPLVEKRGKSPFVMGFGIERQSDFYATGLNSVHGTLSFTVNNRQQVRLSTPGRHNAYNALIALACGRLLGVSYAEAARRLRSFRFPKGRLWLTTSASGALVIDDSYNANPSSVREALAALEACEAARRSIFIMGDMLELGSAAAAFHAQVGSLAGLSCDVFITVGALSRRAAAAARICRSKAKVIRSFDSAREARTYLRNRIRPTNADVILLKGSRAMKMEEVIR